MSETSNLLFCLTLTTLKTILYKQILNNSTNSLALNKRSHYDAIPRTRRNGFWCRPTASCASHAGLLQTTNNAKAHVCTVRLVARPHNDAFIVSILLD